MFLFERSLIGAHCNRLYDLKERQAPFHAKAKSTRKQAHQTDHFFMSQNDHHSRNVINFDYVSLPLTLLKITNGSLCHHSFFLNTSDLD